MDPETFTAFFVALVIVTLVVWVIVGAYFFDKADKEGHFYVTPEIAGIILGGYAIAGPFAYFLLRSLRSERRRETQEEIQ